MSRRFFGAPHLPGSPHDDRPRPVACRQIRRSILIWAQDGLVAALVFALVVIEAPAGRTLRSGTTD
jgi:hypothetical protein